VVARFVVGWRKFLRSINRAASCADIVMGMDAQSIKIDPINVANGIAAG